jgi:pimeloyl-ACP methyl ester carboxylesterase
MNRPTFKPRPAPLPAAVDAPRDHLFCPQAGRIAYYHAPCETGRPLLLVHSINAAPSTFEVKPLFERYAGTRPVYSIELPGFGLSERIDRAYTPTLYASALQALLEQVIMEPADLVALSLSAEFAARAAIAAPDRVATLTLISPTGFSTRPLPPPALGRFMHRILRTRLWSQGLYDLVSSRRSIRYYLGKSFVGAPPQSLLDYAYATARQPGARHAPLMFLSTQLFTRQAFTELYEKLDWLAVLAVADRDPYVTFERLPELVATKPNWQQRRLAPHLGMPHWERPLETFNALDRFWDSV